MSIWKSLKRSTEKARAEIAKIIASFMTGLVVMVVLGAGVYIIGLWISAAIENWGPKVFGIVTVLFLGSVLIGTWVYTHWDELQDD